MQSLMAPPEYECTGAHRSGISPSRQRLVDARQPTDSSQRPLKGPFGSTNALASFHESDKSTDGEHARTTCGKRESKSNVSPSSVAATRWSIATVNDGPLPSMKPFAT